MSTYVAFLRGVNLGPHRRVSMSRLTELAGELGYADAWTYVSSGNLVFGSAKGPAVLEEEIGAALEAEHGSSLGVAVRSATDLRALVAGNPFPEDAASQVTVGFLTGPPAPDAVDRLAAVATAAEPFHLDGREVWVRYGDGQAGSRLAAGLSKTVGVSATVRTLGTLTRLLAKLDG